jgi:hypothetical protein
LLGGSVDTANNANEHLVRALSTPHAQKHDSDSNREGPSDDPGDTFTAGVQVEAKEVDTEGHDSGHRQESHAT